MNYVFNLFIILFFVLVLSSSCCITDEVKYVCSDGTVMSDAGSCPKPTTSTSTTSTAPTTPTTTSTLATQHPEKTYASSCFDGIQNPGEEWTDCGGHCSKCNITYVDAIHYFNETKELIEKWDDIMVSYSKGIEEFNRDEDKTSFLRLLDQATRSMEDLINEAVLIQPPSNLTAIDELMKDSMKQQLKALNAMAEYIASGGTEDWLEANKLIRDTNDLQLNYISKYNERVIEYNMMQRRCFDGTRNQGEEAVDCGGPCTPCKTRYKLMKTIVVENTGGPARIKLNVTAPAMDYPPLQRVENTTLSLQPKAYIKNPDEDILTFELELREGNVKEVTITQDVMAYADVYPAASKKSNSLVGYFGGEKQITLSDGVCATARDIQNGLTTSYNISLANYLWMSENIRYARSVGDGSSEYAYRMRTGACDEHASLFVALERCSGVSARKILGYLVKPEEFGAHAWAEYYDTDGWITVDATVKEGFGGFARSSARHIVSCIKTNTTVCGIQYSYTWNPTGKAPEIQVKEETVML